MSAAPPRSSLGAGRYQLTRRSARTRARDDLAPLVDDADGLGDDLVLLVLGQRGRLARRAHLRWGAGGQAGGGSGVRCAKDTSSTGVGRDIADHGRSSRCTSRDHAAPRSAARALTGTTPATPAATCRSTSFSYAAQSISPDAVKGVTSAVYTPRMVSVIL